MLSHNVSGVLLTVILVISSWPWTENWRDRDPDRLVYINRSENYRHRNATTLDYI